MISLIKEIESCIFNNNLRCALGMALTLPDICAQVEYPDEKSSGIRYVNWCENYLFNQGHLPTYEVDNSVPADQWKRVRVIESEMCYKLRCAYLHSGNLALNQRENDDYPIFTLQITSQKENGIYSGINMKDEMGTVKETTIDIRLLSRVMCNAAREYYEKCETKERFKNHHITITDVEQEVDRINNCRVNLKNKNHSNDSISYDELTEHAKDLLTMFQNGESQEVSNLIASGDELSASALDELMSGGFITLSPNEKHFE